jgi:hypothetical protein
MIYTVASVETTIRSELNESTTTRLSSAEILRAINDGQVYVATRGLCIQKEALSVTVPGRNTIPALGVNVNYIELIGAAGYVVFDSIFTDSTVTWYHTAGTTSTPIGLQLILPTNIGYVPLNGAAPQKWFPWGNSIVIEPLPADRYILKLYYADYPAAIVSGDLEVPKEFQRCVIDFCLWSLCIKLKRWTEVAAFYNKCAVGIQRAQAEYVKSNPAARAAREVPKSVKEAQSG